MMLQTDNNKPGVSELGSGLDGLHFLPFPKEISNWSKHKFYLKHVMIFDIDDIFLKLRKVSAALRDCSLAPNLQFPMSCIGTVCLLGFKVEFVACRGSKEVELWKLRTSESGTL